MSVIEVANLKKYYQVHEKEPGLWGSIKSLVNRKYYDVKAVDDISFKIDEGELVGFIGPNGAGKTTTLKVLSGLLYPTGGSVSVLSHNPYRRDPEFQKQFSLVMGQKNQLWWDLPPLETFILNKEIYEVPDDQYKNTLEELVEMLEVADVLKIQVRKLSLGQRMKCELIAALIHRPKILFLDEPTIGLDVVMQKKMRDFIREYNRRYKSTIILTSHYMDDVKELCERVVVIDKGRLMFDGKLQEIIEKFADHKRLVADLSGTPSRQSLSEVGQIESFEPPRVVVNVPRGQVSERAVKLLTNFQVTDLNIEEEPIEDIIRRLFTQGTAS
ncbi:MAG: ABC transporter ATP-binding protein [Patescibacteria group bacterium]|nr:ABC transporter ATP-binding protein [Patescibacteria group bacterium]